MTGSEAMLELLKAATGFFALRGYAGTDDSDTDGDGVDDRAETL